jgi:cyclophilin family peptidyl-prolyl cis-trans isomerase
VEQRTGHDHRSREDLYRHREDRCRHVRHCARCKDAPQTVNNFVFLAQHQFFDCVIFHRVIPGFVDQTGDPTGTGSGGPGYTIPDEYPAKASNAADQYPLGSVAMANTGQPHTGGSQWFIVAGAEGESLPNFVLAVRPCHLGDERCRKDQCARERLRRPSRRHAPDAEGHYHLVLTELARPFSVKCDHAGESAG